MTELIIWLFGFRLVRSDFVYSIYEHHKTGRVLVYEPHSGRLDLEKPRAA